MTLLKTNYETIYSGKVEKKRELLPLSYVVLMPNY